MKSVRTVTEERVLEDDPRVPGKPEYAVGQWVTVYAGQNEGCSYVVEDIRYNWDSRWHKPAYQYLLGKFGASWHYENMLTTDHRDRHYDRNGYCDNPARGY